MELQRTVGGLDEREQLARRAGVSLSTFDRFWRGGPVRIANARKIIEALRLDFAEVAQVLPEAAAAGAGR